MELEKEFTREDNPIFFKLWDLKCVQNWHEDQKYLKDFSDYIIYAKTTKDLTMSAWNGKHEPSIEHNCKEHICKTGTKVLIWMVSRFGDIGVTDNLINSTGYYVRGLNADVDL